MMVLSLLRIVLSGPPVVYLSRPSWCTTGGAGLVNPVERRSGILFALVVLMLRVLGSDVWRFPLLPRPDHSRHPPIRWGSPWSGHLAVGSMWCPPPWLVTLSSSYAQRCCVNIAPSHGLARQQKRLPGCNYSAVDVKELMMIIIIILFTYSTKS